MQKKEKNGQNGISSDGSSDHFSPGFGIRSFEELQEIISLFEQALKSSNKSSCVLGGIAYSIELNECSGQKNLTETEPVITPKDLEIALERLERAERQRIESRGGVYTPVGIARGMADYVIDRWLMDQVQTQVSLSEKPSEFKDGGNFLEFIAALVQNKAESSLQLHIQQLLTHLFALLLDKSRILDPCVGGGTFIVCTAQKFLQLYAIFYPWLCWLEASPSEWDAAEFEAIVHQWQIIEEKTSSSATKIAIEAILSLEPPIQERLIHDFTVCLEKSLHFCDLSESAIKITCIRLEALLKSLRGKPASEFIKWRGRVQNSLDTMAVDKTRDYSIILGNPPYIGSDAFRRTLPEAELVALREKFAAVVKRGNKVDIYFFFLQQGLAALAPGGWLSFIVPNRLLANEYAENLRTKILQSGNLELVLNFEVSVDAFPGANVHPCIIAISKPLDLLSRSKDHIPPQSAFYRSGLVLDDVQLRYLNLFTIRAQPISRQLVTTYNIFFTQISPDVQDLLLTIASYPMLQTGVTIHEATRLARFQHKFPPGFRFRIEQAEWEALSGGDRKKYVREIRGEDIRRYSLEPPRLYLSLPELLAESNSELNTLGSASKKIADLFLPILFIRELGDRIFAAIDPKKDWPSTGYGGVYYFQAGDIKPKVFPEPNLALPALLTYLSSGVIIAIYRLLFSAGAWGTALKFRTAYLHRLPLLPFNVEVFAKLGTMLSFMALTQEEDKIKNEKIRLIEEIVDIYLLCALIDPKDQKAIDILVNGAFEKQIDFTKQLQVDSSKISQIQEKIEKNAVYIEIKSRVLSHHLARLVFT